MMLVQWVIVTMLVLFVSAIYFLNSVYSEPTLISVVQIYRHGQRTPHTFYPTDPYSDPNYWPVAPGELTNTGKAQHYELGKYTRDRYNKWLPASYSRNIIHAQTSDVDRTHMSAQCNLLGLFPLTERELWNPDISWSPIPVHHSKVIKMFPLCPAYNVEYVRVLLNDPYFRTINETYAEIYKYINEHSGATVTSFSDTLTIFDSLSIEHDFGFTLPSWTEAVFPEPLTTIAGYMYQSFAYNKKLIRLNIGMFLDEMMKHFETMSKDASSAQFFQMYSAHDVNIVQVLSALGVYNPHIPYFASSLYFELWEFLGNYYVNIYYKTKETLEEITPLGCSYFDCELGDLKKQLSDVLVDVGTWNDECGY